MQTLIPRENHKKIYILHSGMISPPYNDLHDNIKAMNIFGDINKRMHWLKVEWDYIILHKKSLMMQSLDFISKEKTVVTKDRFKNYIESYYIVQDLKAKNKFKNSSYKILYEDSHVVIYQKLENS